MNCTTPLRTLCFCLLVLLGGIAPGRTQSASDPIYVFHTSQGNIRVQLFPDVAPKTVANFLNYVRRADYNGSFIHRSARNFVVQGGGYRFSDASGVETIVTDPPVVNEYHLSNVRGTLAMAKLGGDPNSATSQWFFNENDSNATNLDSQNGGFTVFGRIVDAAGLAVMDKIAALPITNAGSPFDELPVVNYQSGTDIHASNLVTVSSITPQGATHVAAGPNGSSVVLWSNFYGAAFVQTVSASGTTIQSQTFGPYTGASAKAVAVAPDGSLRLLWTNFNGTATVWTITAGGAVTSYGTTFGPYSGSTATGMTVTADGKTRLLWTTTAGAVAVWTLSPAGAVTSYGTTYGPYGGGAHVSAIGGGADGLIRLLWTNTAGAANVWLLNANAAVVSYGATYGPYTGASAVAVGGSADGKTRLLWTNAQSAAAVWTLSPTGSVLSYGTTYGPYSGAGARDVTVGTDSVTRLLWANTAGQAQVWKVSPTNGAVTYSQNLGTF